MAQILTITQMRKGGKGMTLIFFKQRSIKPYALPRKLAEKFNIGDKVMFRNQKLCKVNS